MVCISIGQRRGKKVLCFIRKNYIKKFLIKKMGYRGKPHGSFLWMPAKYF